MPRRQRNYLPNFPYHLVQRGNNRCICFRDVDDYRVYLELWRNKSNWYGVAVHAYCLMTNHIHFLVTAHEPEAISNTMKSVGSRYAYYVNREYHRTGTLWEGRHRSSLVDADNYLLACQRYIELNPVRAHLVDRPDKYTWSSYGSNALGKESWISPHPVYLELARDAAQRRDTYRAMFDDTLSEDSLRLIRTAAHFSQPIGDECFRRGIEQRFGLRPGYVSRGRPRVAGA